MLFTYERHRADNKKKERKKKNEKKDMKQVNTII
jgi:hypothetical protein